MSTYLDGFVTPLPKNKLDRYREMATFAGKIWREHGALEYRECVGDDLDVDQLMPFPRQLDLGPDETVVFAYILFESREHRDAVNAKVMQDPRMSGMCEDEESPFDFRRMLYGGFSTIVESIININRVIRRSSRDDCRASPHLT